MSSENKMCLKCAEDFCSCNCAEEIYEDSWKEEKILSLETGGVTKW